MNHWIMFCILRAVFHNVAVWLSRWMLRTRVRIVVPAAAGAVLLGGAGWFAGPQWAVAGTLAGPVAAVAVLLIIMWRRRPDPAQLLHDGRPEEAYRWLEEELAFTRGLAARRPVFRDVLAYKLETMSRVLQALENEQKALEAGTEAAAIFADLAGKRPGQYAEALARTLLQQADLLAHMGRHGEALAAVQPAVLTFRRLAVDDRGKYLPFLAAALGRQAVELYSLDHITESRAAAAEAVMIQTDMLPPGGRT